MLIPASAPMTFRDWMYVDTTHSQNYPSVEASPNDDILRTGIFPWIPASVAR